MFNGMNVKNDDGNDGNQMDDLFGDTSGMQSSTVAPTSTSVPGMRFSISFLGPVRCHHLRVCHSCLLLDP